MGDDVWVKPPNVRYTSQWKKGVVTKVNTNNNMEVNGVPRHVLGVKRVYTGQAEDQTKELHENIIRKRKNVIHNATGATSVARRL